jgi:putative Mg2+ transporter-C (MgtC) family protein
MPTTLGWKEVAIRLGFTVLAGLLIGFDRGEHGRPAGLRTTLLVCLAASVAMLQTNLLLITVGKTPDSFVVLDLMRLPLGILSGMGFIGAGAIIRRGNIVHGITTAATLWFVTVVGLCFGGGQIGLGLVALVLGLIVLWVLKWFEQLVRQDRRGALALRLEDAGLAESEIMKTIVSAGYRAAPISTAYEGQVRNLQYEVKWRARRTDSQPPAFVGQLARRPGVLKLEWQTMP